MSPRVDVSWHDAAERRLLDRYVNTVDAEARAVFVGTDNRGGWKTSAAGWVLGLWPRIREIPVLGPLVHRMFAWLRKAGG